MTIGYVKELDYMEKVPQSNLNNLGKMTET